MLLENELKAMNIKPIIVKHVYEGRYRDDPRMKSYVGRIRIE